MTERWKISLVSELITPTKHHQVVDRDPDDNIIIDCAVASGSDFIISGDNDLLEIESFKSSKIVSPSYFLELIK